MKNCRASLLSAAILVLACAPLARSQDIASFEKRITVKTLDNGLTVLV